ncbi:FtsH-binding integral membrane protein [Constrictibacter sp. MBR-5]|jgi:FtsH-binding integral membrane protein|uniref:Bax inhibitor-1/YccA family protein n=1 Tax=Constrictibacter sp. MBR-5 TaxID=3156467 RepID=UPI0033957B81
MAIEQRGAYGGARTIDRAAVDVGLRKYMLGVYNYMASGVFLTGVVAMLVASSPTMLQLIFGTPLKWVVILSPLAFVLAMNFGLQRFSATAIQAMFWGLCVAYGLSFASIFLVFTGESIARVFFISAGAFAALSLYGYTTKRDLSPIGSFLIMGMFGLIIATVVNMFIGSDAMQFAISVIGVLIFAGLTAYDTQMIKEMYVEDEESDVRTKKSVMGAMALYISFIAMFMYLLQIFGNRN